jgi:DNA-binding response OmpR family regulator
MAPNILVVSDNREVQKAFADLLEKNGMVPLVASTVSQAEALLDHVPVSMVFCSDELPNPGVDVFVRRAADTSKRPPVVVVSRLDDWERYLKFLQRGAFDYVLYPFNRVDVERVVKNALGSPLFHNGSHETAAA